MSLFGSGRREAWLAITLLVLLAVATQAPLLFGWVSAGRTTGEAAANADIVVPALADAHAVWQRGEWPWWNPFARLGEPFTISGAQPLYPGFWPILFGGARALPWVLALHSALACVLMFRWLRSLPASRFAAFLAAGSYGAGVFFQVQLLRLPEAAAAAWLPLALEGVWRLSRPGRRATFVAMAAAGLAAMLATGAHAVPWLGMLACGLITLLNLPRMPRSDRVPIVAQLAVTVLFTLLLAAPIWLATWQHAGLLVCGDGPPSPTITVGAQAFAAVTPWPATHSALTATGGDTMEFALFPGTIVLLMVALALLRPSPEQPRWPWFVLATLGMLAASDGPWSHLLHDQLGLDGDRPGASLVLLQLGLLVLACIGLDGFLEAPFRRTGAILSLAAGAVLTGLAGLTLALLRPRALTNWLASLNSIRDNTALASVGDALALAMAPTAAGLTLLGTAMLFWRQLGILRLKVAIATIAFVELLYLAWVTAPSRVVPPTVEIVGADTSRVLATDELCLERLHRGRAPSRRVNRTGDAVLARTWQFLAQAAPGTLRAGVRVHGGTPQPTHYAASLASLAQIDVLLGDGQLAGMLPAAPSGPEPRAFGEATWARMVFTARHVSSTSAARQTLANDLAPGDGVVLETAPSEFQPHTPNKPAQVRVLERLSHYARLQVDIGQGRGYLVFSEALAPGWQATLDDEPATLLPANVAFAAIAVPEGEHEVELRYAPWSQRFGLPLSGLGTLLCVGWLWRTRQRLPSTRRAAH